MTIGDRLKDARKKRKLTQQQLSDLSQVSTYEISDIETGRSKNPKALKISALCHVLKINEAWLLNGTGEQFSSDTNWQDDAILQEIYDKLLKLDYNDQQFILKIIEDYLELLSLKQSIK